MTNVYCGGINVKKQWDSNAVKCELFLQELKKKTPKWSKLSPQYPHIKHHPIY
jgi:hypothetical protein